MKYKRFYDNLQLTSKDATVSDLILILFTIAVVTFAIIPIVAMFAALLLSMVVYVIIDCLFKKAHNKTHK